MKDNGLKYNTIRSSVMPVDVKTDADILANTQEDAWFIAYLFERVVIGRVKGKKLIYYNGSKEDVILDNLIKMRIFTSESELYIWRTTLGGFRARLRKDGSGEDTGVVDASQIIFGTKAEPVDGDGQYAVLREKRGTEVVIPLQELGISNEEINEKTGRLCIKTRNYIGTIPETGQATYTDVRFVEFVKYQEEKR